MTKYKLRDVATDLNVSNKDIIEVLGKYVGGEPKKTTSILTEEELNIVFDYFTQKNSVSSFDKYYASNKEEEAPKTEKTVKTPQSEKATEKAERNSSMISAKIWRNASRSKIVNPPFKFWFFTIIFHLKSNVNEACLLIRAV